MNNSATNQMIVCPNHHRIIHADNGSIVEVFTDLSVWVGIKKVIDQINANAIAA